MERGELEDEVLTGSQQALMMLRMICGVPEGMEGLRLSLAACTIVSLLRCPWSCSSVKGTCFVSSSQRMTPTLNTSAERL